MANISEKKCLELLKKYATDNNIFNIVLEHVNAVQKVALRIASQCKNVDIGFIKTASLLHDIGRFKTGKGKKGINHGIIGAEIVRKEGLDERYALVCERHIGAGITKEDIQNNNLGLPIKDYLPMSNEEKIIAHADNLIFGNKEGTLQMVIDRFRKELGNKYVDRVKELAHDVENLKK